LYLRRKEMNGEGFPGLGKWTEIAMPTRDRVRPCLAGGDWMIAIIASYKVAIPIIILWWTGEEKERRKLRCQSFIGIL